MTKKIKVFTLGVAALLLAACSGEAADAYEVTFEGGMSHVHGLETPCCAAIGLPN